MDEVESGRSKEAMKDNKEEIVRETVENVM